MKSVLLIFIFTVTGMGCSNQSEVESLKVEMIELRSRVNSLESKIDILLASKNLQNPNTTDRTASSAFSESKPSVSRSASRTRQCQATTKKGSQCKRKPSAGSSFC